MTCGTAPLNRSLLTFTERADRIASSNALSRVPENTFPGTSRYFRVGASRLNGSETPLPAHCYAGLGTPGCRGTAVVGTSPVSLLLLRSRYTREGGLRSGPVTEAEI